LQDFRHRCATEILLKWYQAGVDVERRLPVLSTFLGHRHISETFWYLSGSSELLKEAAQRLENHWTVQP
jgi:integrase